MRDSTSKPKIRLLVSNGHATSLQHLPPRDTTLRIPAVVYVVGHAIDVNFDSGAVQRVTVRDDSLSTGLYLEPERPDSTRRPAAAARPAGDTRGLPSTPAAPTPSPATTTTAPPAVPARRP